LARVVREHTGAGLLLGRFKSAPSCLPRMERFLIAAPHKFLAMELKNGASGKDVQHD
jgi:hypothetical protein